MLSASKDRVKIVFLPAIANRITWLPQDNPVTDGNGIALSATSQPVEVVGQLAKMGWSAVNNVAGPTNFPIIEYYRSDYKRDYATKDVPAKRA